MESLPVHKQFEIYCGEGVHSLRMVCIKHQTRLSVLNDPEQRFPNRSIHGNQTVTRLFALAVCKQKPIGPHLNVTSVRAPKDRQASEVDVFDSQLQQLSSLSHTRSQRNLYRCAQDFKVIHKYVHQPRSFSRCQVALSFCFRFLLESAAWVKIGELVESGSGDFAKKSLAKKLFELLDSTLRVYNPRAFLFLQPRQIVFVVILGESYVRLLVVTVVVDCLPFADLGAFGLRLSTSFRNCMMLHFNLNRSVAIRARRS
jgi:hypothetical protein